MTGIRAMMSETRMLPRSAPRSVASVVVILPREESRFDGRSVPWRLFVTRSIGTAFFCSTPPTVTGPVFAPPRWSGFSGVKACSNSVRVMVGGTSP